MPRQNFPLMPLRSLVRLLALAGGFLLVVLSTPPILSCPFLFLAPVATLAWRGLQSSRSRADFLPLLLPLLLIASGLSLGLAGSDWYARAGNRLRAAAVSAAACAICLGTAQGHGFGRPRRRRWDADDWEEEWRYWEQQEQWEQREWEARKWRRMHEDRTRAERERRERARRGPWEESGRVFLSAEDERAFALLGLAPGASFAAVKKAYHQLIVRHHPDKVGHLGEAARRAAEEKTKELNAAYSRLEELLGKGRPV